MSRVGWPWSREEGSGEVRDFFSLHRLCDPQSELQCLRPWRPLTEHPKRQSTSDEQVAALLAEANRLRITADSMEPLILQAAEVSTAEASELSTRRTVMRLRSLEGYLTALDTSEAIALLTAQAPLLFDAWPSGSIWFVGVEPTLHYRLAFVRSRFALEFTPDPGTRRGDFPRLPGARGAGLFKRSHGRAAGAVAADDNTGSHVWPCHQLAAPLDCPDVRLSSRTPDPTSILPARPLPTKRPRSADVP